ncbi:Anaphase-promoting complex subunit 1, partial [Tieghemiomyces parasiticus]
VKIAASSSTGHTRLTPEAIVSLSSHAGWIFGLGLTRHLRTLVSWSAFQYLATKHVPTAVGLLLGMAAAHLGTADPDVTRLLAVHVPAFLPPNAAELQLSPLTHIAGLMGLGLLHVRTCHRRTVEVLAQEFRGSRDAVAPDAAYVWTIGCGLGLVTLGAGSTAAGLADLHLAELLAQYLEPGSADPRVHLNPTYTRAVQADGHTRWSASVPFSAPSLAGLVIDATEDREGRPPSLMRTPSTLTQAAAATLALSLMYLHTEDRAVADQLALPTTTYLLSRLHPTLALQRTLGRSIILWSLTTPTLAWLLAACPHAGVRTPASLLEAEGHLDPLSDDPADLPRCPDLLTGLGDPIRRVYASAVTGAALALGLKYAGTSAPAATRTLLWWYDHLFLWSKRPAVGYESGLTRQTLRRCFHTTAAAAAMVQAGTGHLPLFRRLRALHGRLHTDISYGDHLLCHMAMGLVFLGAGNYTLSATDPMATAALLISFYPVVNPTPDANTNYLQVFRHLWVLAVERRCVVVRDVADGTILPLTLRVTLRPTRDPAAASAPSTRDSTIATPGSLPDWSTIQTVRLDNVGFWPVEIDSDRHPRLISALRATCTIWVKARPASMLKSIIPAIPSLDRSSAAHPCDLYPLITALYPGVASTGPSGLPMQALRSVVDRLGEWRHFTAWIATGESHYNDPMPGMPTVSLDDAFMADIICAGLAVEEPAVVPVYMHLFQQWRARHGSSVTTPATSDGLGRLYRSLERTECRLVVDFYLRLRPSLPQLAAEVPLISPHFLHLLRHDL